MKVVTSVINNPIFIEIQDALLKKYMLCDYEFIVFNDAKKFNDFSNGGNPNIFNEIVDVCERLGIRCINNDNETHQSVTCAAIRCANACNVMLDFQKKNIDKYLILDSDMFLVDYLDPEKYFNDYASGIVLQSRTIQLDSVEQNCDYIWNGFAYFDFNKLSNVELMDWDCIPGTDVGGSMWRWLKTQVTKKIPNVEQIRRTTENITDDKTYYVRHLWSGTWDMSELPENLNKNEKLVEFLINDPRNKNGKFFSEIYDNKFFHYRAGGNWNNEGMSLHFELANRLKAIV